MKKYYFLMLLVLVACQKNENKTQENNKESVQVDASGQTITFLEQQSLSFFRVQEISSQNITANISAPAKISATILPSGQGASQNVVLFDHPELASNYTQLIQHQSNISQIENINIKQKQIELERTKDLLSHGAATGQDLLNAQSALAMEQTNLANEKAAIIEHEATLVAAGFDAQLLKKSPAGMAYLICDIPENQISKIREGQSCQIVFTAFAEETFTGKIEHIADVVDNQTRMVKLRIAINNSSSKLKAGMFATVAFGVSEGNFISVPQEALVTVQGKNYVFVQTQSNTFQRRAIQTGQQIGNKVIVFAGLQSGEKVAVEGVMQLKGLSFGY